MPTREHIEALARALVPDAWDDNSDVLKSDLRRAALRAMGGRVFAAIASDPAAQDAVLAALVEGGRLVEDVTVEPRVTTQTADGEARYGAAAICYVRLVEPEWREATS